MALLDVWAGDVYDALFYNVVLKDVLANDIHCLDKSSFLYPVSTLNNNCRAASTVMTDSEEWNGRICKKSIAQNNPTQRRRISSEKNVASIYIFHDLFKSSFCLCVAVLTDFGDAWYLFTRVNLKTYVSRQP